MNNKQLNNFKLSSLALALAFLGGSALAVPGDFTSGGTASLDSIPVFIAGSN